jgi:hypothetical protein
VDGFGEVAGAVGAAAEFPQDAPCSELGVGRQQMHVITDRVERVSLASEPTTQPPANGASGPLTMIWPRRRVSPEP